MYYHQKIKTLINIGIALIALMILSLGLSQMKLLPGEKTNLAVDSTLGGDYGSVFNGLFLVYMVRWIYVICFLIVIGLFIFMLLTPERRKKLLKFLAWAVPLLVIGFGLLTMAQSLSQKAGKNTTNISIQSGQATVSATQGPTVTFTPNTSSSIVLVASIVLAIIIGGLLVFFFTRIRREEPKEVNPLMQLADQAQNALDDLQAGGDLKNAVLRCYFEMSRVMQEQHGVRRKQFTTTREFENELFAYGLPEESVRNLTSLFEQVRYGSKLPTQQEEQTAIKSLTTIIACCKEGA